MLARWKALASSVAILGLLSACQQTTVPLNSTINIPPAFDQIQAAQGSTEIAQWWQHWHDPVLSQLIEQGMANNHDVQIAVSRLEEARASSRLAWADLGVNVAATGSLGITQGKIENPLNSNSRALLAHYPPAAALSDSKLDIGNHYSLLGGISASWEPDVFGRKRSDADAARYAALGVQEQRYGAQLLIAGEIAQAYMQARAAQAREQSARNTIATLQRMLQYLKGRFQAGQVSAYEVNQAKIQLTAAQAKLSTIQAEYAVYVRHIAVLTGQVPQGFILPRSSTDVLARLPAAPSGQTPQGMLEHRPDVRALAMQVQARAAQFASAKADLLPRFTINFLGGSGRIEVNSDSHLTGWSSLLSLGISVPIFTNGRIQANIAAADARLQTALLQYDQAILKALGEVDNAYQTEFALQQQQSHLSQSLQQATQHSRDTEKLFRYGNKTLDHALEARLQQEQIRESLIQSRLIRAQTLIRLYQALGGGWTS